MTRYRVFTPLFGAIFLFFVLIGCATGDKGKREVAQSIAVSKYEPGLPATDFDSSLESDGKGEVAGDGIAKKDNASEDKVGPAEPASQQQVSVRPVILLEHNYTIQLGVFELSKDASEFISMHQLSADEAGIAEVLMDGSTWFLLAYGVYAEKSAAETLALQLSQRLNTPTTVWSLAEIEAISLTSDENN